MPSARKSVLLFRKSVQNTCRIHKNAAQNLCGTCSESSIFGTESWHPQTSLLILAILQLPRYAVPNLSLLLEPYPAYTVLVKQKLL